MTFAGIKTLLELYKMSPDKDAQYVTLPGDPAKIAAVQRGGLVQVAPLAPSADYVAPKAGFKQLVNVADRFKDTSNENPATKSWPN